MANKKDSPFITTGERIRSFIGWAFVISLAIHFVFAPFLKNMTQRSEQQEVEKVSVTKKIIVKPPTPPPPTPTPPPPKQTPQPQQKPQQQPQPKLKVQPPKTTSNSSSTRSTESKYVAPKTGSENGVPQGQGTAAPAPPAPSAPAGTPKPACRTPYQDATAVQAVTPDYPDAAREQGLGEVQVTVIVTISPSGSLVNATIGQGSGNMSIDQAALSAARQSTYAPKIVNCQPVEGTYNFKVTFDPNS
jgi:periplasmic protein TonB